MFQRPHCFLSLLFIAFTAVDVATAEELVDTFPPLAGSMPPANYQDLWGGFDPRAEPLEIEVLHEWEQEGVVLRVVRFRIGVFKGTKASLAAVYGYPKGQTNLPGLLQIHGGGQYAHANACLQNAKRGYATVSISWAGRINAPDYRVDPAGVKRFWSGDTNNPEYKATTDWGAVDGYHAPSRFPGRQFPSMKAAEYSLDAVESPRNSGWFLAAVAARRALTFLEQQPEVDADRLGVYGHSMGGKLTVATASDPRVKAAVPSCGGISDRYDKSELFNNTLGDAAALEQISCPIFFQSPSNDFHGRMGDLPAAINEIKSTAWRVTCSAHHNHQDTGPYECASQLWFDQHLRGVFSTPGTPEAKLAVDPKTGVPRLTLRVDPALPVVSVDFYYTQNGKTIETKRDRDFVVHRFWRHVEASKQGQAWAGELPLSDVATPLWAYANVTYQLPEPVIGAGYYYRNYKAERFVLSSLLIKQTPSELASAGAKATLEPSVVIEDFRGNWQAEWFTYRPNEWPRSTNKLADQMYKAPAGAKLAFEVQCAKANKLVVVIDKNGAEVDLTGGESWQEVVLAAPAFQDVTGEPMAGWDDAKLLQLTGLVRIKPARGVDAPIKKYGGRWDGPPPRFRNLRWVVD